MTPPLGRTVAATLLLAYVAIGPAYRHITQRRVEIFVQWKMFRYFGSDVCQVKFSEHRAGGEVVPLNRYELLELGPWQEIPVRTRLIKNPRKAAGWAAPMCDALGPDADIRVATRCGSGRRGWLAKNTGDVNLCVAE